MELLLQPVEIGIDARLAREMSRVILDTSIELCAKSKNQPNANYDDWQVEDWYKYGYWLQALVDSKPGYDAAPTREHFNRASKLGIGPHPDVIVRHLELDGFANYKNKLGHRTQEDFNNVPKQELLSRSIVLSKRIDRRPVPKDIERWNKAGTLPSEKTLSRRFGSLAQWHELIGFWPMRGMEQDDYLDWGAALFRAIPDIEINAGVLRKLSAVGRGPSVAPTYRRFDSLAEFDRESHDRYKEQIEDVELSRDILIADTKSKKWREETAGDVNVDTERELLCKKLAVATLLEAAIPGLDTAVMGRWTNKTIPEVMKGIVEYDPAFSIASLEIIASRLGLDNHLWPGYRFQNIPFEKYIQA